MRKVDDLVQALGMSGISKSQVSKLCGELDERVQGFLKRELAGQWPYVWLDATYLKSRENGHVVSRALVVAVGVNQEGRRMEFLRDLAARGFTGVRLVISDAHQGLKKAAEKVFGATWSETADRLRERFPKLGTLMDEAESDVLAFTGFPKEHWKQIASTNPIERVNKEIKRRSNVIGIFPNDGAILRLVGALIIERNEEWHLTRRYMSNESLARVIAPAPENKLLEIREVA